MQNMENSLNLFSLSWNTGLRKTEKITSKTSLYTGIVAFSLTEWKNEAFNSLQNKLSQNLQYICERQAKNETPQKAIFFEAILVLLGLQIRSSKTLWSVILQCRL